MPVNTNLPLMGQSLDTASPLVALSKGLSEKQRYDQQIGMKKEEAAYNRQQDALNRERQTKLDDRSLQSQDLQDEATRAAIVKSQFDTLDAREQSRIRNVSIAAAQAKALLDAGDTEGALNFAKNRIANLHKRIGAGENIDTEDTDEFIRLLESGKPEDLELAKNYAGAMVQVGQYAGVLKAPEGGDGFTLSPGQERFDKQGNKVASGPPKPQGAVQMVDPDTGEITYTNPSKPMPAAALRLQNDALDGLATASNIQADLSTVINQIDTGKLKLGLLDNAASNVQNYVGASDEVSRNYGSFGATLEKLRNDSLRLNKGVQTEGDAVRAWNELMKNLNDEKLVSQRLKQIKNINQRVAELKQLEVDNIHSNYNQPQIDYTKYQKGSALDTSENGGWLVEESQ